MEENLGKICTETSEFKKIRSKQFAGFKMKTMKTTKINFLLILIFCTSYAAAQTPNPNPQPSRTPFVNEVKNISRTSPEINKKNILQQRGYIRLNREKDPTLAPFEISKTAAGKIEITKEDRINYKNEIKNYLNILKVFSAPSCAADKFLINAKDENCTRFADLLRVSHYSFLWEIHGEYAGDFRIVEDNLIAGNGKYIHGLLVDLGEIEIKKLDKKSLKNRLDVKKITNFPIAVTSKQESEQRQELEKGIIYQNLQISASQKLAVNHIYLMRLISYSFKNDKKSPYNKDSVFLFKVAKLNQDKMAVILWKKLSEKDAPRLENE